MCLCVCVCMYAHVVRVCVCMHRIHTSFDYNYKICSHGDVYCKLHGRKVLRFSWIFDETLIYFACCFCSCEKQNCKSFSYKTRNFLRNFCR